MRLILVRHGEAYAGFHGPIAGPTGCQGLTPEGRRQAEALRDHLAASGEVRADVLMASVLPRAIETATIIAPGLGLELSVTDCDLCEVHTGEADGTDWSEYNERYGSFDMEAEPDRRFAPGGDSWNSFHERVRDVLDRLAREHADETVVAVCHAGVIIASMRLLLGIVDPSTSAHLQPTNTSLTVWEHQEEADRWLLHGYNDAGHLFERPSEDDEFSPDAARAAEARDELGSWVGDFLRSPGSDNELLAQQLRKDLRYWVGPIRVRLDQLHRLAGPSGHPVLETVDEDDWRDDVDDLRRAIESGAEPTPVIASYRDGQIVLEDGNHRVEAARRAGEEDAWTVVGFEDASARDRFLAEAQN
ncbi:MAG: histidine phosphatase family protein [Acidimicrobiia bacterium]|nr:histidine phosphatase family protein [Acidimicrobiia bacterium]